MSKKYVIEDRYIPAHELSLKMRKKYPVLKAYYDGGVILLDSIGKDKGWTPENVDSVAYSQILNMMCQIWSKDV